MGVSVTFHYFTVNTQIPYVCVLYICNEESMKLNEAILYEHKMHIIIVCNALIDLTHVS